MLGLVHRVRKEECNCMVCTANNLVKCMLFVLIVTSHTKTR